MAGSPRSYYGWLTSQLLWLVNLPNILLVNLSNILLV
jgi:hypothetical protein